MQKLLYRGQRLKVEMLNGSSVERSLIDFTDEFGLSLFVNERNKGTHRNTIVTGWEKLRIHRHKGLRPADRNSHQQMCAPCVGLSFIHPHLHLQSS